MVRRQKCGQAAFKYPMVLSIYNIVKRALEGAGGQVELARTPGGSQ